MTLTNAYILPPMILLGSWAMFNSRRSGLTQLALRGIGALVLLGSSLSGDSLRGSTAAVFMDAIASLSDVDLKPRCECT